MPLAATLAQWKIGLGTGGLIGGSYDVDQADMQDQTLAQVGRHVPPGSNALLAEVDEYADDVVDERHVAMISVVQHQPA